MTTPAIRFVYFDLGNVLVAFDRRRACDQVAELLGCTPDQADVVMHVEALQQELEWGRMTDQAFHETLHARLGSRPFPAATVDQIRRAISDMFTPIDAMRDVIAGVRALAMPIGILSNTCSAHWEWILQQRYAVMEGPFDVCVLSHEVRSMKPDAGIYDAAERHARRIAGAAPSEILFLDDREENVDAAMRRGWRAECCLGGDGAIAALAKHGIPLTPSQRVAT